MLNCSIDLDQHGVQHIRRPLLPGGVDILSTHTGLLSDRVEHQILTTDDRFQAYVEFRDEAIKIAASQLVSRYNSPVDLFHLTGIDEKIFQPGHSYENIKFHECNQHATIADNQSDGSGTHSISAIDSLPAYVRHRSMNGLRCALTYFAYRKYLVKLDFIQWNSDPEEVLKRLKCSNEWSELQDHNLKHGLERHMHLTKEYKMSKVDSTSRSSSISESFEKVALEKINWEQGSKLEELLHNDDWIFMEQYFNHANVTHLSRECATQARNTGIVLVEKALPIREGNLSVPSASPTASKLLVTRQKVKQALEGCMGSLRRISDQFGRGAARGKVAAVAFTAVGVGASVWTGSERDG